MQNVKLFHAEHLTSYSIVTMWEKQITILTPNLFNLHGIVLYCCVETETEMMNGTTLVRADPGWWSWGNKNSVEVRYIER